MSGPALRSIRIVTILSNNNEFEIYYAFLEVPVLGDIVDNFRHGETDNLLCGIDFTSGRMLYAKGIQKGEHSLLKINHHPNTRAEFKSIIIYFLTLHKAFGSHRSLPIHRRPVLPGH